MRDHGRVTLLDDIQTDATDRSVTLSDLLRKCQILAYRLRHEPFKEWVAHELTGYPDEAALPAYRGPLDGQVRAHLVGTFGREAKGIAVPITNFPKEMRDRVTEFRFYQGVATLDALIADARRNDDPRVISPFPVEVAAAMPVWQGYQTISMWSELPVAAVAGILDQVRSRALEFVLEIEAENPEAGTAATAEPPVPLAGRTPSSTPSSLAGMSRSVRGRRSRWSRVTSTALWPTSKRRASRPRTARSWTPPWRPTRGSSGRE
jgi:hypothetical protein